jgi:hypothetical protein
VWLLGYRQAVGVSRAIPLRAAKVAPGKLGLLGEQAVAEQLHLLARKGYEVFHDVPGDGKWNIDHMVAGPAGVFAIETKARTKQPGRSGEPAHKASFDGRAIRFPRYVDRRAVEQASRNGKWLGGMLSKATGERIRVMAIVALPGWMVELLSNDNEVMVLSGKQVPGYIAGLPAKLSDKAIAQLAYQLDQRCRDLGF